VRPIAIAACFAALTFVAAPALAAPGHEEHAVQPLREGRQEAAQSPEDRLLDRTPASGGEAHSSPPRDAEVNPSLQTRHTSRRTGRRILGLVLLVPRALGNADHSGLAVALAVATGLATATGIGGPAKIAAVAPLRGGRP